MSWRNADGVWFSTVTPSSRNNAWNSAGDRLVIEVTNTDEHVHDLTLETGADTGRLSAGESARIDVGVVGRDLYTQVPDVLKKVAIVAAGLVVVALAVGA